MQRFEQWRYGLKPPTAWKQGTILEEWIVVNDATGEFESSLRSQMAVKRTGSVVVEEP